MTELSRIIFTIAIVVGGSVAAASTAFVLTHLE